MSKLEFWIVVGNFAFSSALADARDANQPFLSIPDHAIIRQSPGVETLLGDAPQKTILLKGSGAEAKAALAAGTAVQARAMVIGGPARLAVPYVANGASKVAHMGRGMITGHGTDVDCVELDALTGTTAGTSLRPGQVEILVPLNQYLPSADAAIDDVRPVLLKIEASVKDQVRVLAARHVELKQRKSGRFDLKAPVERTEGEVEETVLPSAFEMLAHNVYRISTTQPLAAGEYALVFRKKAESGRYTSNVVLRSALPAANQGQETQISSGSKLADLMKPPKTPTPAQESAATNFLAFDFRVLP